MEGVLIPTNPIEYAGDYTVPKGHDIRVSAAGGDVVATGTNTIAIRPWNY